MTPRRRAKRSLGLVLALSGVSAVLSTNVGAAVQSRSDVVAAFDGEEATRPSLKLDAAGNPAVAFFDPGASTLKVLRCDDPACRAGGDTIFEVASISSDFTWPSLVLNGDGHPVVAFENGGRVDVLHCNDRACAPGGDTINTVASEPGLIGFPAVALNAAERPIIVYLSERAKPQVVACTNIRCATHRPRQELSVGDASFSVPSIAVGPENNPVVALERGDGLGLDLYLCQTPLCDGLITGYSDIQDNYVWPVVSVQRSSNGFEQILVGAISGPPDGVWDFRFFTCNTGDGCPSPIPSRLPTLQGARNPYLPDMAVTSDGDPVMVYADLDISGNLHVVSNHTTVMSPDPDADGLIFPNIELHTDDTATIAYVTTDGLKIVKCNDAGCVPTCNDLDVTVDLAVEGFQGFPGRNDVVRGTPGPDQIDAGYVICALGGDDIIYASTTARVFAGAGNDRVTLDRGNNFVSGGPGNDVIIGANGRDRLFGGPGADRIDGRGGTDRVSGGDGNDTLFGSWGDDTIFGNLGRDTIDGGPGNDIIKGGAWLDAVDGGDGDDDRCGIVAGEVRVNCERGVFGV